MAVEAMLEEPTTTKSKSRNRGSRRKIGSATGMRLTTKTSKTHRIAVGIPAFDPKIARISVYRRHKHQLWLAALGKV